MVGTVHLILGLCRREVTSQSGLCMGTLGMNSISMTCPQNGNISAVSSSESQTDSTIRKMLLPLFTNV